MNAVSNRSWVAVEESDTEAIARMFVHNRIVRIEPGNAFPLSSGSDSPGFLICADRLLGLPGQFACVCQRLNSLVNKHYVTHGSDGVRVEAIAGVERGGGPFGIILARDFNLPYISVPKEGDIEDVLKVVSGKNILVVEDVATSGSNIERAVEVLRIRGGTVLGALALAAYELPSTKERFARLKVPLHVLTTVRTIVEQAVSVGAMSSAHAAVMTKWIADPYAPHKAGAA